MNKKPFSPDELKQLAYLDALPDDEIDTVDIPEAPAENMRLARRPGLYRPVKQPVTIRLDADVVAWFKDQADAGTYQTEINRVLRAHVLKALKRGA